MKDIFAYESPFGFVGKLFSAIILAKYLKSLLIKRNTLIKEFAETDKWQTVLNNFK